MTLKEMKKNWKLHQRPGNERVSSKAGQVVFEDQKNKKVGLLDSLCLLHLITLGEGAHSMDPLLIATPHCLADCH